MTEIINGETFTRTLTGFDELAIHRLFGKTLGQLQDGIVPRALLFIEARREGMNDADAFRKVMEMTLGEVETRFQEPEDVDPGKATEPPSWPTGGPTS